MLDIENDNELKYLTNVVNSRHTTLIVNIKYIRSVANARRITWRMSGRYSARIVNSRELIGQRMLVFGMACESRLFNKNGEFYANNRTTNIR